MNRTPSRGIEFTTPMQKLHDLLGTSPNKNLEPRVFGCTVYVHQNSGKLEPRATRCFFLGYADFKKGYRCLDPATGKVYITRDVSFHETIPYFSCEGSLQGEKQCNGEVSPTESSPVPKPVFQTEVSTSGLDDSDEDYEPVPNDFSPTDPAGTDPAAETAAETQADNIDNTDDDIATADDNVPGSPSSFVLQENNGSGEESSVFDEGSA